MHWPRFSFLLARWLGTTSFILYLHKKSWNLLHCLSLFLYTMAGIFRFCPKIIRAWNYSSRSQVVMKKSSNDTLFRSKRGIGWKYHLSEIWQCFHSNNDVFTFEKKLTTWEQENESKRKKEPQILRQSLFSIKAGEIWFKLPIKVIFLLKIKALEGLGTL
jgi:hypothetical protein